MDLFKRLAAERKEILKSINRGKKQARALLQAMRALKVATAAAGQEYGRSVSRPKRKRRSTPKTKPSRASKSHRPTVAKTR